MPTPDYHRGALISRPDLPNMPWRWTHDKTGLSGSAASMAAAVRQIDRALDVLEVGEYPEGGAA
ncbi:hypothetical protein [uncultured Paracoccus sp.]|uniref:hypothetical protein n=1 Tax=uncultured Paracoccus sp. TaxID=189685 RepID=UPI0025EA7D4E|nr:hypothetical protein [uncultured Paracoccus sp.]